jgi:Zn-dependent protease/Tfp pilus assembly protein PilF
MKPSLLICRVGGTDIRLHWSLLLLIPYVYWAFRPIGWLEGARTLLFIGLIFLCVLLHELGHLVMVRGYGLHVSEVVLLILGGVTVYEREAEEPMAQLMIAVAGPLVNLLIAALLLIALAGLGLFSILVPDYTVGFPVILPLRTILFLILTNLILAVSNLIPIYPMDGGRIFKAYLQMIFGQARSIRVTFWISILLAGLLMIWGLVDRNWLLVATALLMILGVFAFNQNVVVAAYRLYARLTGRADVYIRLSDFDPAVEILTRRIQNDPRNPDLYLQRAYAGYFMDDLGRALADSERVLALAPDHLAALLLRGALFYALGQRDGAWECVRRAEQINPGWIMIALNQAILQRDEGHYVEALGTIQRVIDGAAKEPALRGPVLPLLVRSTILFALRDREGAKRDWDEALRANAREATLFSPDRVRIFAQDWAWAETYFTFLRTRAPERGLLPVTLAEVAMRAGRNQRAAEEYSEAIRRYPAQSDLSYYRGLVYAQMGEKEKAATDFSHAVQSSKRAHIRRLAAARLRLLEDGQTV